MTEYSVEIQHFLNKDSEPVSYLSENYYPLCLQISVLDKKTIIKSRLDDHLKIYQSALEKYTQGNKQFHKLISSGYLSENSLKTINNKQVFPIYNLLDDEVYIISKLINHKINYRAKDYDLQNLETEYKKYTQEITDIFDDHIKNQYIEEVKYIFLQSIDKEKEKEKLIFNISNYLIHFINWNNSFYDFYESTFDLFPSALKNIENCFSPELRNNIKAYMAYHNNINPLKRHFEKRELGKISTLSFVDWQIDIKDIILKQLSKYFGNKKANEYINCLDKIIIKAINED